MLFTIARLAGSFPHISLGYLIALDAWLLLTLLFANFATALAEARGKAQADSLRMTRRDTPARRLRLGDFGLSHKDVFLSGASVESVLARVGATAGDARQTPAARIPDNARRADAMSISR